MRLEISSEESLHSLQHTFTVSSRHKVFKTAPIGGGRATRGGDSGLNSSHWAMIMWWSVATSGLRSSSSSTFSFSVVNCSVPLFLRAECFHPSLSSRTSHLLHFLFSSFYQFAIIDKVCQSFLLPLRMYRLTLLAFTHTSQSLPLQLSFLNSTNRFIAAFNSLKARNFLGELYN